MRWSGVDLDADDENAAFVILSGDEKGFASFGVDFEQREEVFSAGLLNAGAHHETLRFALLLRLDDVFQRDFQRRAIRQLGRRSFRFRGRRRGAFEEFVAVVRREWRLGELGHLADFCIDACTVVCPVQDQKVCRDRRFGCSSLRCWLISKRNGWKWGE